MRENKGVTSLTIIVRTSKAINLHNSAHNKTKINLDVMKIISIQENAAIYNIIQIIKIEEILFQVKTN